MELSQNSENILGACEPDVVQGLFISPGISSVLL